MNGTGRDFRIVRWVVVCALAVVSAAGPLWAARVVPDAEPKVVARFDRGQLLDIGGQRALLVAGSPYQMGYQHGVLLREPLRRFVRHVLMIAEAARPDDEALTLKEALRRTGRFVDRRFHEEMRGLADGAGVDVRDVELVNVFPELFHCSGFALFGRATVGGRLWHGRILDYMTEAGLQEYTLLLVAKPDGHNAFVSVGYVGFVGSVTGMNAKQVAFGEMGGRGEGQWDGVPMAILMRKGLEEADTLAEAVALFRDSPRTCEYYYVISDGKGPDARGLACTPDRFETVAPGQAHPLLPHAIEDVVLMSADERYEHLARRVKAQYGRIDLEAALDLMNRPIAMESCLHRVLFAPKELELWVAHAVSPEVTERYAAAYQPYYHYDFKRLLAMIPAKAPAGVPRVPAAPLPKGPRLDLEKPPVRGADSASGGAGSSMGQVVRTGRVGAEIVRADRPAGDARVGRLLSLYPPDREPFEYTMERRREGELYAVWEVRFPSPVRGALEANNTVYCEYYVCPGSAKRPAVIVLDILEGSMTVSRLIANTLAAGGVDAAIMTLPYYGPRRGTDEAARQMTADVETLVGAVRQAVQDVRRTARFLASRPTVDAGRIGLCGTSLGGCIAALAGGVDGGFDRVALILAGGDLATVLTGAAKEVREIREELERRKLTREELAERLASIEPLTFAERLRGSRVLMVNGSQDTIIPPVCARRLAEQAGAEVIWRDCDHYGMTRYLLPTLTRLVGHFGGRLGPPAARATAVGR